ncbi:hypothetical protein HED60_22820 [Planctomycetales bacterium ZRK34]|nr:hypothetical protein HED60_22820 [Planctomycetales bacterium ZRK34]
MLTQTVDATSGLVPDAVDFQTGQAMNPVSIAGVGMQLVAGTVGVQRGWIDRQQAAEQAERVLRFLLEQSPHNHGWMYHFIDPRSGARAWRCEVSSIDTALLVAGALVSGQFFHDTPVRGLAQQLYERIDFEWMLTDGGTKPDSQTLCMGWKPESGFLKPRWDQYSELMILYQLAIGSPTHPIPAETWAAFERPMTTYGKLQSLACGPLFTHQYAQLFIDFRKRRDALGFNYFTSSVNATRINRQFCIDRADRYSTFSDTGWGLSACLGAEGYRAYGATHDEHVDGTINPSAAVSSIVFTPQASQSLIDALFADKQVFGRFGLVESYNADRNWRSPRVVALDAGMAMVAIENYRTGLIWQLYMSHPATQRAMQRIGFADDARDDLYIQPQLTAK